MVSEVKRKNKFTPRKKYSPERLQKQRAILERARERRNTDSSDKTVPIKPMKERLAILEGMINKGINTNNNEINNNEADEEIGELQAILDFQEILINTTQDEITTLQQQNKELNERIDELEISNDVYESQIETLENDTAEMKKLVNILWKDLQNQLASDTDSD